MTIRRKAIKRYCQVKLFTVLYCARWFYGLRDLIFYIGMLSSLYCSYDGNLASLPIVLFNIQSALIIRDTIGTKIWCPYRKSIIAGVVCSNFLFFRTSAPVCNKQVSVIVRCPQSKS